MPLPVARSMWLACSLGGHRNGTFQRVGQGSWDRLGRARRCLSRLRRKFSRHWYGKHLERQGRSWSESSHGGASATAGSSTSSGSGVTSGSSGGSQDQGGAAGASGDTGSGGNGGTSAGGTGTGGANAGGNNTTGGGGGGNPGSDGGRNTGGSNAGGAGDSGVGTGGSRVAVRAESKADGGGGGNVTCPATKLAAGDTKKTVSVGGKDRTYTLHVPSAYKGDAAVPFIIDFHGIGGNGSGERTSSSYPKTVDAEGVVMAFPDGASGPGGNAWNVGPCCVDNVDDVAFAKAMVTDVEKVACVDPKRVYAVGFSMGGGMSHYIACHGADVFAAVAPAAFDLLEENVGTCKPPRPITVFFFRGTSRPYRPLRGRCIERGFRAPHYLFGRREHAEEMGRDQQVHRNGDRQRRRLPNLFAM